MRSHRKRKGVCATLIFWGLFFFIQFGCEHNARNFSQYSGFAEYFRDNPPSHELPDNNDRQLLYRFRPRFMLSEGEDVPIDFYNDYITNGILVDAKGNEISSDVTRDTLNLYKNEPDVVFKHIPGAKSERAVVYGRIDRQNVPFDSSHNKVLVPLIFLTYHSVFANSGMPAGIPAWQNAILSLFFDLDDWHQLDHYTAVTLILVGKKQDEIHPIAIMLQQHDNLRTYLIGETILLPDDGRVVIDVAKRSNELYPFSPQLKRRRAVYMPDPESMHYLLTGENKPLFASHDITNGIKEVDYSLEFLPHNDAFYTFKGFLGERRNLKGRDAPPGADYNTLPELKPLHLQLFSGYWREGHRGDIERLKKTIIMNGDYIGFAKLQGAEFYKNWRRIQTSN